MTTRIKNWKRWWIIVDIIEDLDIISPLLPQMGDEDWNNGQIILTTQNASSVPSNSLSRKHISLSGGMNDNECRQLLSVLSGTDADDPLLDEVAKQLDNQPLAMAAAAVYVKEVNLFSFISFDPLPIDIIVNYIQQLDQNCHKDEIYLEIKHCLLFLFEENEDHIDVRIRRVVHEAVTLLSKKK